MRTQKTKKNEMKKHRAEKNYETIRYGMVNITSGQLAGCLAEYDDDEGPDAAVLYLTNREPPGGGDYVELSHEKIAPVEELKIPDSIFNSGDQSLRPFIEKLFQKFNDYSSEIQIYNDYNFILGAISTLEETSRIGATKACSIPLTSMAEMRFKILLSKRQDVKNRKSKT